MAAVRMDFLRAYRSLGLDAKAELPRIALHLTIKSVSPDLDEDRQEVIAAMLRAINYIIGTI
jgi:hypothetical protein